MIALTIDLWIQFEKGNTRLSWRSSSLTLASLLIIQVFDLPGICNIVIILVTTQHFWSDNLKLKWHSVPKHDRDNGAAMCLWTSEMLISVALRLENRTMKSKLFFTLTFTRQKTRTNWSFEVVLQFEEWNSWVEHLQRLTTLTSMSVTSLLLKCLPHF